MRALEKYKKREILLVILVELRVQSTGWLDGKRCSKIDCFGDLFLSSVQCIWDKVIEARWWFPEDVYLIFV